MATAPQVRARNGGAGWLSTASLNAIIARFGSDDNAVDAAVWWTKAVTIGATWDEHAKVTALVAASNNPSDTRDVLTKIQDDAVAASASRWHEDDFVYRRQPTPVGGRMPLFVGPDYEYGPPLPLD